MDYIYYTGSTRQASDYETTIEYILNCMKGTLSEGNDIAEALKQLKYADTDKWYPYLEFRGEVEKKRK